jgi:adenylylsulfate kinase-like enzyme
VSAVRQIRLVPKLVILTGPIAAGKNTVADALARRLTGQGRTVVVVDVDDVAAMVATPGATQAGLWFAAHEAHGALVGQWMRSSVEYVVVVGPIYTAEEQAALTRALPDEAAALWVVIDAPCRSPSRVHKRIQGVARHAIRTSITPHTAVSARCYQ